jgi:hypothetical protein
LDPTRVAALLSTAIELQETLTDDKARFRAFLMQLLEESSDSGSEGR